MLIAIQTRDVPLVCGITVVISAIFLFSAAVGGCFIYYFLIRVLQ